jgi:hypothetical protein
LVEKERLVYWSIFLLVAGVFPLCIAIYVQSPWAILVVGSWFILLCYLAYLRLVKKREPRYPLVPPEGKPDVYTGIGIPRPIHEDFDEMKRKREKLEMMSKRKKH